MSQAAHILLVEDDVRLTRLIREYLELEGFRVDVEHDGARAVGRIADQLPDLVVLDHMLPGMDGLSVLREVRRSWHGPVLMLTARRTEVDQIVGLELGADDYVAKPASPRLLLARIKALLRRSGPASTSERHESDGLVVDATQRTVHVDGHEVDLSSAEFDLLWVLVEHIGRPVSRETLLQRLRGIHYDGIDRSIDVRCSALRRKLSRDGASPDRILTVRGVGYQLTPGRS